MSDSQQPQTPLARLEQLERQIASKVEEVVHGLRHEIGQGVRDAGEEIQRLLQAIEAKAAERPPEKAPEAAPAPAPAGPDFAELVKIVARIDGQSGQADVIRTLLSETAPFSSRAVFFLVRQHQIRAWSSRGFGSASGRVEGVHATTDQAPWSSVGNDAAVALDADQVDAFAQALGSSAGAQAAWIPFLLRGQLAGALYVDRLEGDGSLDVAPLQLLTHCAGLSLETAASSPGASATLALRGKLPEVIAEEHTIAVDADEEVIAEEVEEYEEVEEIEEVEDYEEVEEVEEVAAAEEFEAEVEDELGEEAESEIESDLEEDLDEDELEEPTEATEETTGAQDEADESTEITTDESTADRGFEEDQDEAEDQVASFAIPAMELPKMKLPEVAVPEVAVPEVAVPDVAAPEAFAPEEPEELPEPPDFEMVEDEVPEYEIDSGPAEELPAEAFAAPPEVPEMELGEPEPAPEFEVAEAPEVPDIELGEPEPFVPEERMAPPQVPDLELESPDEVSTGDIAFEAEDETPLDEEDDTNIWEVEDDEPTAVGDEEELVAAADEPAEPSQAATQPVATQPVATPTTAPQPADFAQGVGNETVRIDTSHLRQAPQVEPPPAAAVDSSGSVQYPASFAEPPPPVQPPPPSFAEPETTEESFEPSSSQVVPPPDLAPPQPASQVVPPADATPTSEVAPPEPSSGSTEVKPPTDLEGPGLAFAAPTAAQTEREMDDAEEALHEEARRLARLLVSEIKLYNEEIIEEGRRTGNIYDRLKDDINRSRQMYEERIDPRLADQEDYFQQELVQRLAGGDASLLGM